jgi:hypothetical protein
MEYSSVGYPVSKPVSALFLETQVVDMGFSLDFCHNSTIS